MPNGFRRHASPQGRNLGRGNATALFLCRQSWQSDPVRPMLQLWRNRMSGDGRQAGVETADDAVGGTEIRRTGGRPWFPYLAICLVCGPLIAYFRVCLDRGLADTVGTGVWGRMLFAVGAAITEMEHGGYGYTISEVVETVLTRAGLTGDQQILDDLGVKFPDNLRDSKLIDAAIDKAVRFKWPFNPNEKIRGSGGDNIGLVDFAKLSFRLFGYKLFSFYLTYFAVWSISVAAFVYAFRWRPALLTVLVIACFAQALLFTSAVFDSDNLGSLADPRFLSVLAI